MAAFLGEQSSGVYGANVLIIVALTISLLYSAMFVVALSEARSHLTAYLLDDEQ